MPVLMCPAGAHVAGVPLEGRGVANLQGDREGFAKLLEGAFELVQVGAGFFQLRGDALSSATPSRPHRPWFSIAKGTKSTSCSLRRRACFCLGLVALRAPCPGSWAALLLCVGAVAKRVTTSISLARLVCEFLTWMSVMSRESAHFGWRAVGHRSTRL